MADEALRPGPEGDDGFSADDAGRKQRTKIEKVKNDGVKSGKTGGAFLW